MALAHGKGGIWKMPMQMMDQISLKSFVTPEVQKKLTQLKTFDAATVTDIYEVADMLALSVRDAALLSIACSLKRLKELEE